jgi:hypothetical protein
MSTDAVDATFTETRSEQSAALAVLDNGSALGVQTPRLTAETMLAQLHEFEKFKAMAVRPKAWVKIPGVKGEYLPADETYRLAPAFGVTWEILTKNEHGELGVRCEIVDFLTYEKKTIRKNGRNGETYEAEIEDTSKPIISKTVRYTVSMRCTDGSGRFVDVEGSFDRNENPKSDYMCRQQALTRARRRGLLILIGGVDVDVLEEERAAIRQAAAARAATKAPSTRALIERAVRIGACTGAPASFLDWVNHAAGITKQSGDTFSAADKRAVIAALDKFEGIEPPAPDDAA